MMVVPWTTCDLQLGKQRTEEKDDVGGDICEAGGIRLAQGIFRVWPCGTGKLQHFMTGLADFVRSSFVVQCIEFEIQGERKRE